MSVDVTVYKATNTVNTGILKWLYFYDLMLDVHIGFICLQVNSLHGFIGRIPPEINVSLPTGGMNFLIEWTCLLLLKMSQLWSFGTSAC